MSPHIGTFSTRVEICCFFFSCKLWQNFTPTPLPLNLRQCYCTWERGEGGRGDGGCHRFNDIKELKRWFSLFLCLTENKMLPRCTAWHNQNALPPPSLFFFFFSIQPHSVAPLLFLISQPPTLFSYTHIHTHTLIHTHKLRERESGSVPNPFHVIKYKEDNLYNIPQNYYFPTTGWWIWHLLATSPPPLWYSTLTGSNKYDVFHILWQQNGVQSMKGREESAPGGARDAHELCTFRKIFRM